MLKNKLKERKGFTLAELLVVIAILAILIAIAVPVFTHMVAESNLRVNQANVHSVRSAAVSYILTNLGEEDALGKKLNTYMNADNPDHYWTAVAQVDNNGNISNLRVIAFAGKRGIDTQNKVEGISTVSTSNCFSDSSSDFFEISDDVKSSGDPKVYYVQAIVTDLTKK